MPVSTIINGLWRPALLGAATGCRSTSGLAALALSRRPDSDGPAVLRERPGLAKALPALAALAAIGEGVGDKLPKTPSRLRPPGPQFRLVSGLASGWIAARRTAAPPSQAVAAAAVAGAVAVGTTYLGARWRSVASGRLGVDLPGALAEDLVTAALAAIAVR